jgi:hypothetical protein
MCGVAQMQPALSWRRSISPRPAIVHLPQRAISITFAPLNRSISAGTVNEIGIDNITLGSSGALSTVVPTLSNWGFLILVTLLAIAGVVVMRRQQSRGQWRNQRFRTWAVRNRYCGRGGAGIKSRRPRASRRGPSPAYARVPLFRQRRPAAGRGAPRHSSGAHRARRLQCAAGPGKSAQRRGSR